MRLSASAATLLLAPGCRPVAAGRPATTPEAPVPAGAKNGSVPSADGVPIHYHAEGDGSPALVFVHGWSCDGSYWSEQVRAFSPRRRVTTIDLAGHGQSGKDRREWTIPAFAQDVRAVIEALDLERVVLVGHSMSGVVILEAARLLPGRVVALIPVDTLHDVTWKPGKEIDDLLETMQRDFPGAARQFVKGMFPPGADPDLVETISGRMSGAPPAIAMAVLRAAFTFDAAGAMAQVRQPIRAINSGTYPTKLETNRRYAPQFEAVIIQGTGHFPMLEKPEEFNRLLGEAIADLAAARP